MSLIRLMYCSKPAPSFQPGHIKEILHLARERNQAACVTGALVFHRKWFLQVIEGSRGAVTELFLRIARDPRHEQVHLMECVDVHERHFGEWNMAYCADTDAMRGTVLRFAGTSEFAPTEMSATSALRLMAAITGAASNTDAEPSQKAAG